MLPEDAPVRLTNAQLEELDYRKLYAAYSSRGRKSVTDPRVLFKILVYGYQCGIYSTRKLEEACRYRIDFKWLLWDEPAPDHSTISRFRTGRCAEAMEDLFYQYVRYLELSPDSALATVIDHFNGINICHDHALLCQNPVPVFMKSIRLTCRIPPRFCSK